MYERFALLLKENNLTAYRVAKETNISQTTFSEWKNGRSNPKLDKMQLIADYFHVTLDWLMGNTDERQPIAQNKKDRSQAIGNQIKKYRKARHMTLLDLSKLVNLSESTLQRYESGLIHNISTDVIENFATALNIPVTVLLSYENENSNGYYTNDDVAEYAEQLRTNSDMRLLFDVAKDISKEDLTLVVNIIKDLKERDKR